MKFLSSLLASVLTERELRRNLTPLFQYLAFLGGIVALYSVLFHVIKLHIEGESHSWLTGLYWTLVVMTTLGFGDITFTSDIGRLFSVIVLLSGIVLLLILLPFIFIRFFYAPWLESRIRLRAPRHVPGTATDFLLLCRYDSIAPGLIERIRPHDTPYYVLEPDPARAAFLLGEGVSVVAGEIDSRATYEAAGVDRARLVVANCEDTTNTNITLTIREINQDVPVVAIVDDEDSIDILELSGATHVLPLKQRLGEHVANRVSAGRAEAHIVGSYRALQIAEFPVRHTPLAGQVVRDTHLRARTGVNVVGLWQRGRLRPAFPQTALSDDSVVVVVGTAEQMARLNDLFDHREVSRGPVLVIGGGKVGRAAARSLKRKGVPVHLMDRDERILAWGEGIADRLFTGDASDRGALMSAGLADAPSVILTTNDDAMNIYLAVYCRRLNPDLRIISRITHERNVEAIHRAGADFVLSYASLGVEAVFSLLHGRELVLLGEGVDLFVVPVPGSLAGKTLAETGIGSRSGLSVVAIQQDGRLLTTLSAQMRLAADAELIMLGSLQQRQTFAGIYEAGVRS